MSAKVDRFRKIFLSLYDKSRAGKWRLREKLVDGLVGLGGRMRWMLYAFRDDLVHGMEVAAADRIVNEALSFGFELDYHLTNKLA